jgi:hypothetical protein
MVLACYNFSAELLHAQLLIVPLHRGTHRTQLVDASGVPMLLLLLEYEFFIAS